MLYKQLSNLTDKEKNKLFFRESEIVNIEETVSNILKTVKDKGDIALREFTLKFDGVDIEYVEVTKLEIENAIKSLDANILNHLRAIADNIKKFHTAQLPKKIWFMELKSGIELGQKITPLNAIGAYIPGGKATYPSTVLMATIPAIVAGVKSVSICTPPKKDGSIDPLILAASDIAGVNHIYKVGGAHAIGAFAYGTKSISKVDKIIGPGNIFVTSAKMQVRNTTEIDFPAGPSEVLIIADDSANARMIASDIIAQLEHDPNAISVLLTTSKILGVSVKKEVEFMHNNAKRKEIIDKSILNAAILIADCIEDCIEFSNEFAPEHLEIMVEDESHVLEKIENAGSIFIGNYAPVSAGDYASGTNHILPTAGHAKVYSGLNINHFIKYISIQKIDKKGLESLKDSIISIAEMEGLYAHADAVRIRFEK
jgi:histidinol dehydrogenase